MWELKLISAPKQVAGQSARSPQASIQLNLNILLIPNPHLLHTPITIPTSNDTPTNHTLLPPAVSSHHRIIICRPGDLSRKFLERLPLRLRNQQRRENPTKHKKCKNLHHMIQPR